MWFRNIFQNKIKKSTYSNLGADRLELSLSAQALRQLDHLQLSIGRFLPGKSAGLRPSTRRKPAYDFRDHRVYVPGDDVRHIDWKVSARHENVFIRQGEQPKDAPVYLLVDCSASMNWGSPPKRDALLRLAAALGYLALAHGDRLTVVPFGEINHRRGLGPISGKGQVPIFLNFLRSLTFNGGTDLNQAVLQSFQKTSQGGLVLILSDFIEIDNLTEILQRLPAPSWDVVLIQMLDPEEIDPTRQGNFEVVDIETGRTFNYDFDAKALKIYRQQREAWQRSLEETCTEGNGFYTLIPTNWSLEKEIISHLRSVHIVRPL